MIYKIEIKSSEEISAICAIENVIAQKKMTLNKLDCEPLRDFQKREINNLINFLASLKNKQLIGG